MGQDVGDERLDDVRFTFGFDLHHVEANIAHEAVNVVTRREPAHRFTEEYALNHAPNLHASPLAHIKAPNSIHSSSSRTIRKVRRHDVRDSDDVGGDRTGDKSAGSGATDLLPRALLLERLFYLRST